MTDKQERKEEEYDWYDGRDERFLDVDRMVNEGLGGGTVSPQNGYIGDSTTDTMDEDKAFAEDE